MDKRNRILIFAIIISLLLHLAFFYFVDFWGWLLAGSALAEESQPQEVTIVFPENKLKDMNRPREVVENVNENEEVPEESNLLSDRNSRARNPERSDNIAETPASRGNSPFSNLSNPETQPYRNFNQRKFSREALKGETKDTPQQEAEQGEAHEASMDSQGSGQTLEQKKFSVEEMGALTLSTYRWDWAPYINSMKKKLHRVWYPPSAYYMLGLIHGYTIIKFTIDRSGNIIEHKVLKHEGHESLQVSSEEAIKALFPFLPLPVDFPEETLTITAKLFYPNLRLRR